MAKIGLLFYPRGKFREGKEIDPYFNYNFSTFTLPDYGIHRIKNYLMKNGHQCDVIEISTYRQDLTQFLYEFKSSPPDILGFSLRRTNFLSNKELAKWLREGLQQSSNKPVFVCGGGHATQFLESILHARDCPWDFGVHGFGEKPLIEMAQSVDKNDFDGIKSIPGVGYRENGEVHINPIQRLTVQDMKRFGYPQYDKEQLKDKFAAVLALPLGFGCIYSVSGKNTHLARSKRFDNEGCAFCTDQYVCGDFYLKRDMSDIKEEIVTYVEELGVPFLRIIDPTLPPKTTREFCEWLIKYRERNGFDIKLCGLVRVDYVDPEGIYPDLLELMAQSGFTDIFIGVESGNNQVLYLNNKGTSREQVVRTVKKAHGLEIGVHASFIMGLPGENFRTFGDTVEVLKQIAPYSNSILSYPLGVLPHSLYSRSPEKFGIRFRGGWKERMANIELDITKPIRIPSGHLLNEIYDIKVARSYFWILLVTYIHGRLKGRIPKEYLLVIKRNLKKALRRGYISGHLNSGIFERIFRNELEKIAPDKLDCKPEVTSFMSRVCGETDVYKFSYETDQVRNPARWEYYRLRSWENARKILTNKGKDLKTRI